MSSGVTCDTGAQLLRVQELAIPLEICPTSNLYTTSLPITRHIVAKALPLRIPLSVCTDDPGVFRTCNSRCAARHTLHVTCNTSHVTRHTSHVTRHTSHVTRHTLHIKRHMSHDPSHTSHITRRTLHVTRHTSHVTHHTSCREWALLAVSLGLKGADVMRLVLQVQCVTCDV